MKRTPRNRSPDSSLYPTNRPGALFGINELAPPSQQQSAPGAVPAHVRGFSVYDRNWGDNKKPDFLLSPEAYVTWRDRALDHLARERPDIRRLLRWAEKQANLVKKQKATSYELLGVPSNADETAASQ